MPADTHTTEPDEGLAGQSLAPHLAAHTREYLQGLSRHCRFTHQELRRLCEIARDLEMWGEPGIHTLFPGPWQPGSITREEKKRMLNDIQAHWESLRAEPNRYRTAPPAFRVQAEITSIRKERLGLGYCPVASPRTRCCNLLTLDAVDNCGYGCSYCSIQSFYSGNQVGFDSSFAEKLQRIPIEPDRIYHIGTGQSSDSLMWGNSHGVLDALIAFAAEHPNVILELKTKSANIQHLLRVELPKNILCTWSLNTTTIIEHEELGSAALEQRLQAARQIADKGGLVGFHFHPMIHYQDWQDEYGELFLRLQSLFSPPQVAMVSLGTLTYIKPVLRQIRERGGRSQILKMPLVEAEGKLSYPEEMKLALFRHAYDSFSTTWKDQVFFYLCMEHPDYWQKVFGHAYPSNAAFEQAMKQSYLAKIRGCPDA